MYGTAASETMDPKGLWQRQYHFYLLIYIYMFKSLVSLSSDPKTSSTRLDMNTVDKVVSRVGSRDCYAKLS